MKVGRIVAALHPRRPLGTEIETLAEHARALDAELIGLFIEDIEMLRFAAMPFACEIGTASARKRPVDIEAVERYMVVRAAEVRETLSRILDRTSVAWTFRIGRGTVCDQLLAVGTEREEPVLLLPPGARIELTPIEILRSESDHLQHALRDKHDQPILLLPR